MNTEFFERQRTELVSKQSFEGDFVLPDYGGLNLKNLLPQIGAVLGVGTLASSTAPSNCLAELKGVKKVVLVIFDGLGYNRLLHHIKSHNRAFTEFAQKGVLKPMTTVFPSTTSTALTSLFSGVSPAQHQIIGYHMFSKKYGLIYNTLDMKPLYGYSGRVELAQDYSHQIKPLLPNLEQNGINTCIVTKSAILGSGLSEITHRDQKPMPYLLSSDMWTHTAQTLETPGPSLSVVYYSGVDNLSHKYGPYSKEVTFELTSIEHNLQDFIQSLSTELRQETLLVVAADHGIAEAKRYLYLKDNAQLMGHLMLPPVGDGRASYIFCKPNQTEQFLKAFSKTAAGFKIFPSEDLIKRGVFGEPLNREELKEKLGDLTVLSDSDWLLDYPFFEDDREHPQLGAHGGMTAEEMIVPLLSVKLSNL